MTREFRRFFKSTVGTIDFGVRTVFVGWADCDLDV